MMQDSTLDMQTKLIITNTILESKISSQPMSTKHIQLSLVQYTEDLAILKFSLRGKQEPFPLTYISLTDPILP